MPGGPTSSVDIRLGWKCFSNEKHPSLFVLLVSDDEKMFHNIDCQHSFDQTNDNTKLVKTGFDHRHPIK